VLLHKTTLLIASYRTTKYFGGFPPTFKFHYEPNVHR